jgi:TRAP-type C4-dicarboxylate transport system permease small subunit
MDRPSPAVTEPAHVEALVWFGVLGGPVTWALAHLVGVEVTQAACSRLAAPTSIDPWALGIAIGGGLVAAGAEAASIHVFRATRSSGEGLPLSRIHFLSVIGMAVSLLFFALLVMAGLGSFFLPECVQS